MIGKHIPSPKINGSFGGLNDYITGRSKRRLESEKVAFSDCVNLISVETATTEMESLALQNKRCADPVMHLLLSWRENESPTKEQVREAVEIALDEMNLSECQAVYALHQNTDNMHLHICVNRVNPNTLSENLSARYDAKLPTIVTTELAFNDIIDVYGQNTAFKLTSA